MGHESPIELWSPKLTTFCFAGFGTNRFRCQEAMKTAGRENPKRWALVPSNRAHGAVGQNNSRSIKWAAKQEKFQPKEKCFFLTSTFIELIRHDVIASRYSRSMRCGARFRWLTKLRRVVDSSLASRPATKIECSQARTRSAFPQLSV